MKIKEFSQNAFHYFKKLLRLSEQNFPKNQNNLAWLTQIDLDTKLHKEKIVLNVMNNAPLNERVRPLVFVTEKMLMF